VDRRTVRAQNVPEPDARSKGTTMTPPAATAAPVPPGLHGWRDRKRWGWLLSVVGPGIAASGTGAQLLGATHVGWLFVPLVVFYLVIPLIDLVLGEDPGNPPEAAVPALEADTYYRAILIATLPVLWTAVFVNVGFLATHDLPPAAWLATVMATGAVLGFGLNVSHELGHKHDRLARKLALFNTALGAYGHFSIEHNRGHHRHVATPEDPASAKMGEGLWRFALREMPGAFVRAWRLEADRLRRLGRPRWQLGNEILQAGAVTVVVWGTLVLAFGWRVLPVLAAVAWWGAFQLTSANYVEHYGLLRRRGADGRVEPCRPRHSWNSNHLVSNLVVFHLQRHSDHHAHPGRGYQSLRDFPDLPRLPSGYFGMFLLAYLPPLWFRVMDPRVVQAVHGRAECINFLPARRDALMRRHGLAATPG
jgi:alkane 1-monooxygenase